MSIFISDPLGELTISTYENLTRINSDDLEIEFVDKDNSFFVSLTQDGKLKITKSTRKNSVAAKLTITLANEIIIC